MDRRSLSRNAASRASHDALPGQPNPMLTPHIGSATGETRRAMAELAARNLVAALTGGRPEAMVNPEAFNHQVKARRG